VYLQEGLGAGEGVVRGGGGLGDEFVHVGGQGVAAEGVAVQRDVRGTRLVHVAMQGGEAMRCMRGGRRGG
jgi:hypothetical protein